MNSINEVENEIAGIYHWYAKEAPGVTPIETGHLANLWALADRIYEEEP